MYKNMDNVKINLHNRIILDSGNKAGEQLKTDKIIPVTPIGPGDGKGYAGGDLRKSITTKHMEPGDLYFEWISKGTEAPYNKRVHELPNDSTNWSEPGTGNKYLERPVNNHAEKLFTKAIREGLKANGF